MGKPFEGTAMDMALLTPDSGTVIVEGILFKKDSRTIKNDRRLVTLLLQIKKHRCA